MNKKGVIIIAILAMLAVTGFVLWLCNKQDEEVIIIEDENYTGEILELDSGEGTLETLLGELD